MDDDRERGDEIPYCGRKPKVTAEDVRRLREWASYGRNMSEVAARLGVNRRTVSAWIRGDRKRWMA